MQSPTDRGSGDPAAGDQPVKSPRDVNSIADAAGNLAPAAPAGKIELLNRRLRLAQPPEKLDMLAIWRRRGKALLDLGMRPARNSGRTPVTPLAAAFNAVKPLSWTEVHTASRCHER